MDGPRGSIRAQLMMFLKIWLIRSSAYIPVNHNDRLYILIAKISKAFIYVQLFIILLNLQENIDQDLVSGEPT